MHIENYNIASDQQELAPIDLKDVIQVSLTHYFSELEDQPPRGLYELLLSEIEFPLIQTVMNFTNKNQTRAAEILGLSRGTFRKLLKKYDFID